MVAWLKRTALAVGLVIGVPVAGHQDVAFLNLSGSEWLLGFQDWDRPPEPLVLDITGDGPGAFKYAGTLGPGEVLRIPHQGFVTLGVRDPAERREVWLVMVGFEGKVCLFARYDPSNPTPATPQERRFGRLTRVVSEISQERQRQIVQPLSESTLYLGEDPESEAAGPETADEGFPDVAPPPDLPAFGRTDGLDEDPGWAIPGTAGWDTALRGSGSWTPAPVR
jgi:hypothetical protein